MSGLMTGTIILIIMNLQEVKYLMHAQKKVSKSSISSPVKHSDWNTKHRTLATKAEVKAEQDIWNLNEILVKIFFSENGPTYGIRESFGSSEKKLSINFCKANTKFCLSLHYNGDNSYLFVNEK